MAEDTAFPQSAKAEVRQFYVYVIFRASGSPCYVGKGKGRRLWDHFRRSHNRHLGEIVAGARGQLRVSKVDESLTEAEAFELERFLIGLIGRVADGGPLVNQSTGGVGGSSRMMSHKEREARREVLSRPDVRARMRASHLGRKQSQETKDKRAAKLRGMKRSREFCEQNSARQVGKKMSALARENMSLGRQGMKFSRQHRERLRASLKRRYQDPELRLRAREFAIRGWATRRELQHAKSEQLCSSL